MSISKNSVEDIIRSADLYEVVSHFVSLKKTGSSFYGTCPFCNQDGKGKGLQVTPSKGIYKCFSCGAGGKSPVNFLMESQGMKYPEALKWLADKFNVTVEEETRVKGPKRMGGNKVGPSFRDRQLAESGIEEADQKAIVWDDSDRDNPKELEVDLFTEATRTEDGRIVDGDDMMIRYYDLNGKPIIYQVPKSTRTAQLWRMRWQIPDLHKDSHGRPMKYTSPWGSGSHLFIPEPVRRAYRDARVIERLYIQEGEKKSVKATKHGIFSVGVMGIQNIGTYKDGAPSLPYDLLLLVQRCQIKEVVFLLDSDFDHLSHELQPGNPVEQRPKSFFYAVRNFKDYFKALGNTGIYLELYFGHVKENEGNYKGIDDLLTNQLKGKEDTLKADIDFAITSKDGQGQYMNVYKISTVTDLKLQEYWSLQNVEVFAAKYKDRLKDLKEFKFGHHQWKFDDAGKVVPAAPLNEDERFIERFTRDTRSGDTIVDYKFRYMYCYNFLHNRGFGRYRMLNKRDCFIHIENKIVDEVDSYFMRDFVIEFTRDTTPKSTLVDMMDFLFRGGKQYLGPDSLSHLNYLKPYFEVADKNYQYLYFKDKVWKISADKIEERNYSELEHFVWSDKVINFSARQIKGSFDKSLNVKNDHFIDVVRVDQQLVDQVKRVQDLTPYIGQYLVTFSKEAEECHFAKFLVNTSEFFWKKMINPETRKLLTRYNPDTGQYEIADERTIDEKFETNLHFVSKMTAIGYLLHKYRDKSVEKAVIAMDGKLSEVGESNGRTGKSLFGFGIGRVISQTYIGAKSKDLTADPFIWEEVSEKTDNVFLDDVRANVDFEFFFPTITGQMTINVKAQKKYTLPESETPKLFLTTNHAINGASTSFKDRQFLIAFSDWYNDLHKPLDDFGINFFNEWDEKQWNLFYNFMACCLQLYFHAQANGWGINRSGLIAAPTDRLDRRRLRQFIGESFLLWADEYYSITEGEDVAMNTSNQLNIQITRKELYDNFLEKNPNDRKYVTPHLFKKKMKSWCDYRGLHFNPHKRDQYGKPGYDDKSGGLEFFMIGNRDISSYGG